MAWVKLDDRMPQNAKLMGLSDRAKWVYIASMCYAASGETDGAIPAGVQREMGWARARKDLVEAGLWHERPCGEGACQETPRQREKLGKGGHVVHDFLEYNPSHAAKEEERVEARRRMRDVRANKGRTSRERSGEVRETFALPRSPSPGSYGTSDARTRADGSESEPGRPPGMPSMDDAGETGAA